VLPAGGPGDFGFDTQSRTPRNVFISRVWLAEQLNLVGRANALVGTSALGARDGAGARLTQGLAAACRPADHGLNIAAVPRQGYLSVTSRAMLLTEGQVDAIREAARECGGRAALTSVYLATRVAAAGSPGGRELAYAIIAAVEPLEPWPGKLPPQPEEGGVWLNEWAAEDLGCPVGTALEVSYLVPTADGTYPTATMAVSLESTVPLAGPAADSALVPDFEGLTDAQRVQDWDPPFPIDLHRVTERDEAYWDRYRATPKLLARLSAVRTMWQSGPEGPEADWVTSVRVAPGRGDDLAALQAALTREILRRLGPETSGLAFSPIRERALESAQGTSDFGQLFLGLSMFLVASAGGLAVMLLRLAMARRAADVGLLLACGWEAQAAGAVLFAEGAILTALGALAGVPLGVLYGAGLVRALGTWWRGAVGDTPALGVHVSIESLLAGGACGLLVGLAGAGWGVAQLRRRPILDLLAGWQAMAISPRPGRAWPAVLTLLVSVAAAALLATAALTRSVSPQAAFFGLGAALLVGGLAAVALLLGRLRRAGGATRSLPRLALRSTAAVGGRSLLTMGLIAGAGFVLVATATNVRDLSRLDVARRESGAGGFTLRAVSSVPLPFDPSTPTGRRSLGFAPEDEAVLAGTEIVSFRASSGEDVSCLNLARPSSPCVLGVPPAMVARGGFSVITRPSAKGTSPWELLEQPADAVPAFGDAASVEWSLHSGLGRTLRLPAGDVQFVGLLPGSVFAGELLVSQRHFRQLFPSIAAPSYFLVATPPGREGAVAEVLRRNLGELGLQVRTTREVLGGYLRVQNTYLSVFLVLGGLGLMLGTLGLGAALVRSALERRSELALLSAVGLARPAVGRVLLLENGVLLVGGLVWGTLSALVAVAPHLASAEAQANWAALAAVLAAILAVGLGTCRLAVEAVLRSPLVPALRRE
jgi:hypothetical protein